MAVLALAGLFWLVVADSVSAVPFVVADGDFSGGIYELRYYPKSNQLVENGVVTVLGMTPLDDLFLTNSGNTIHPAWERAVDGAVSYLQAVGETNGFGSTFNTSASATMGWDFSGLSSQFSKVELVSINPIFQFVPFNDESLGDTVFGEVATPAAFGAGPFTTIYSHTSDNADGMGPTSLSTSGVIDITGLLSGPWLDNPDLLELKFGYELVDTDIPGRHIQLFRDGVGTFPNDSGFMLRVTLVPEPSTLILAVFILFAIVAHRLCRHVRYRLRSFVRNSS